MSHDEEKDRSILYFFNKVRKPIYVFHYSYFLLKYYFLCIQIREIKIILSFENHVIVRHIQCIVNQNGVHREKEEKNIYISISRRLFHFCPADWLTGGHIFSYCRNIYPKTFNHRTFVCIWLKNLYTRLIFCLCVCFSAYIYIFTRNLCRISLVDRI